MTFKFTDAVLCRPVNFAAGVVFLCLATSAAAASNTPSITPSPTAPPLPDVGESFVRVLGALAFVLGLFFAGVWLFRRAQGLNFAGGRTQKLRVVEARSLGGRQAVYVIGYGEKRVLVGASPNGIQHLRDLPDEAEPVEEKPSFGNTLKNQMKGK